MNGFWNDTPALRARLGRVETIMEATVRDPSFPLGEEVARIALSQGKMLRPALLIVGSGFGRRIRGAATDETIDRLAAAVELLHTATLIHDDVLDRAETRRGLPTLHTRFGTVEAVLAGDWLLSRCFRLASENAAPENARALSRLVGAVCSAEIAQDLGKFDYTTSVRRYLRTIAGKTAALFSLALHTGASESKANSGIVGILRRAGYCTGMAFQVIDDILDYESTEDVMGKPVGNDLREGLCTLPLIHALKADPEGMRALLRTMRGDSDGRGRDGGTGGNRRHSADPGVRSAEVGRVVARVVELGGIEAARRTARLFTLRANREIARLPDRRQKEELSILVAKLLTRAY